VGLLELAKQLGNVSQACQMMGYSRDSFYRFKELYETGREMTLLALTLRKPHLANFAPAECEAVIVDLFLELPAFGQIWIANEVPSAATRSHPPAYAGSGSRTISRP
jgi:hypothetical protein